MYAVIKTGGKQYKVAKGDVVKLEKLNAEAGKEVVFTEVLALGETVGAPLVKGASVVATVLEQKRDDKIIVFKKKRRQNYRRKNGHRQSISVVKIVEVLAPGAKYEPKAEVKAETKAKAEPKAEPKKTAVKAEPKAVKSAAKKTK